GSLVRGRGLPTAGSRAAAAPRSPARGRISSAPAAGAGIGHRDRDHSASAAAPFCRAPALDAAAPRRAGITFGAGGATGLRGGPAPPPFPAPILPRPAPDSP